MVQAQSKNVVHSASITELIDQRLGAYADFSDDCPAELGEAIRYSLLAPGKRLRPRLVLLAATACSGESEAAMPAACAVEMIHAYSLIHDDLPAMDDDDLRRGRPTCHKKFGEATAILAGDALQALAFETLARDIRPAKTAARCCQELAQAAGACLLVGGQAADLAGDFSMAGLDELAAIHRRKTGALLLVSLRLGGIVADASGEQMAALDTYGSNLGLAFQITDDLLDVSGDEAAVGKRLGKDVGRGKLTYPALLGVEESRQRAGQLIDEGCAALTIFDESADALRDLACAILERNH